MTELQTELQTVGAHGPAKDWSAVSVEELIQFIEREFHSPENKDEIAKLLIDVDVVNDTLGDVYPEIGEIAFLAHEIVDDLLRHMEKEETVLFPWLRSGRGTSARAPIRAMSLEHQNTVKKLDRLRAITPCSENTLPQSYTQLLERLAEFDWKLREHMHLENNVLFLRTLQGW